MRALRKVLITALLVCAANRFGQAADPRIELLWPAGAPGAIGETADDQPSLTVWTPDENNRLNVGVVVCPGGGYGFLANDHEGKQIAEWLNSHGISAFVLKYRLAPRYKHPAPLMDVRRAIRWVRSHADEFKLDPARIGILGFSAGGHLASTAATQFEAGNATADDPVDRVSTRPDFAVLCYPVISMVEKFTHGGSKKNLLGESPSEEIVRSMSSELRVTAETPPVFLFHTMEDEPVPPENSIAFFQACRKAGVPVEMHIYERGKHGVGLAAHDPILSSWPDRCIGWMRGRAILPWPRRVPVPAK